MINPPLALAGIAEMALDIQILSAIVALCLLPIILVVTMITRSRGIGILGLIITLGMGLLCEPWHIFMQKEFIDPDKTYWVSPLCAVSWWWLIAVVLGVPAFVLVLHRNWNIGRY